MRSILLEAKVTTYPSLNADPVDNDMSPFVGVSTLSSSQPRAQHATSENCPSYPTKASFGGGLYRQVLQYGMVPLL